MAQQPQVPARPPPPPEIKWRGGTWERRRMGRNTVPSALDRHVNCNFLPIDRCRLIEDPDSKVFLSNMSPPDTNHMVTIFPDGFDCTWDPLMASIVYGARCLTVLTDDKVGYIPPGRVGDRPMILVCEKNTAPMMEGFFKEVLLLLKNCGMDHFSETCVKLANSQIVFLSNGTSSCASEMHVRMYGVEGHPLNTPIRKVGRLPHSMTKFFLQFIGQCSSQWEEDINYGILGHFALMARGYRDRRERASKTFYESMCHLQMGAVFKVFRHEHPEYNAFHPSIFPWLWWLTMHFNDWLKMKYPDLSTAAHYLNYGYWDERDDICRNGLVKFSYDRVEYQVSRDCELFPLNTPLAAKDFGVREARQDYSVRFPMWMRIKFARELKKKTREEDKKDEICEGYLEGQDMWTYAERGLCDLPGTTRFDGTLRHKSIADQNTDYANKRARLGLKYN